MHTSARPANAPFVVLALILLAATACKPGDGTDPGCVVHDISLTPPAATVSVGGSLVMQADVSGAGCSDAHVFWSTDGSPVASVSQDGVVTGVAVGGPATIAASVQGVSATATVMVTAVPVASVVVTSPVPDVVDGRTLQLTAVVMDAQGTVLTGRGVTWSSSDSKTAAASIGGLVTGITLGVVTITATSEGVQGTVPLSVVGRLGYAVITDPNSASPPLPPETTFNSSDLAVSVTRTGIGLHTVTFNGLGTTTGHSETLIVNAVGQSTGSGASCAISSWTSTGANLTAGVQCVSLTGKRQDVPFSILLLGDDALGGRTAFARATSPATSTAYAPPPNVSFNPSGKGISIARTATGRYTVTFTGDGSAQPATVLVTPYGADATCQIDSFNDTGAAVSVRCTDFNGIARNTQFTVALVDEGRAGKRAAFAEVDCSAVSCAVPAGTSWSSSGGAETVTRSSAGVYRVTFADLARESNGSDVILVAPVSATGACEVVNWANALNGRDMVADVQCYAIGLVSSPADIPFDVLLIE